MGNKVNNIPARLHAATEEGIVTGADEIYDDELLMTQADINAIVLGGAISVSLKATPTPVFVGSTNTINLVASSTTPPTSIQITGGNISTPITQATGTDSITPATNGNTVYTALFTIGGMQKTATASVAAVYPIYVGAGAAYTDVDDDAHKVSARTSYKATYNIVNSVAASYIWFLIPSSISTTKPTAKMNGFDFPLEDAVDATINGVAYKVYRSSNTQDAGTYPIVLS